MSADARALIRFPYRGSPVLQKAGADARSLENPSMSLSSPSPELMNALGIEPSSTGITITPQRAMAITAVYACVRVLANAVASLPLPVFMRVEPKGKEEVPDHPLFRLLHDRPNPEMSSFTFREALQHHLSIWGNGYAEKEFDNAGRIIGLWPLLADRTRALRKNGEKIYSTEVNGQRIYLSADRVLHIPGLGFDGLQGYSSIALARQALGLAAATEEYGARFFGNGSRPGGVLQADGKVSKEAKANLRESWERMHSGLSGAQRVAILEEGLKWQTIGIPPEDAQFLETRKFQVTEIARFFGVPPHMIADLERGTFSNIEQQGIEFVTHTVRPLVIRWEQVLNWELFSEKERGKFYSKFLLTGLMRGDSAARGTYYRSMWNVGALSVNDIRELEDMNPVDGGDQRFVPLNTIPLDRAGDVASALVASKAKNPGAGGDSTDTTGSDNTGDGSEPSPRAKGLPETFVVSMAQRLLLPVWEAAQKREHSAARRAAKRSSAEFDSWKTDFYPEHREWWLKAILPVAISAAEALRGEELDAVEIGILRDVAEFQAAKHAGMIEIDSREDLAGAVERALGEQLVPKIAAHGAASSLVRAIAHTLTEQE